MVLIDLMGLCCKIKIISDVIRITETFFKIFDRKNYLEPQNYKTIFNRLYSLLETFSRTATTRWKKLISFDNLLDKGSSILSDHRARNCELQDLMEDG